MDGGIVKGGLTPKMILDDIFFNFPTPFPIYSSSLPLPADDSFVDQLLNFNNFDPIQPPQFQQQQQQFNNNCTVVVNSQKHVAEDKDKDSPFLSLPIHTTEEAELEWLSHFVDDSFSPYSTPFPPGYVPKPEPEREPERKRTRAGRWVRPTSKSDSSPPPKKKVLKQSGKGSRTCRHCGTKKTPQWRGGPNGLKTLCNACGVRFKGGRLLPEYRPASSPTYKSEVHSNSHRKVMEMRMVKGGLTPNMILDDVFFNFPTPFPIHSSPISAHDSFLDQLLNLNNFDVPIQPPQFQQFNNNSTVVVNSQQHVAQDKDKDKDSSFHSLPIHNTEEAELERLSHFVDDSFSPYSTPFPPDKHEREPERKRTRTGRWVRPTSKSPPPKKQVRKESDKEDEQRRCSHCEAEKTPLWRSGPNGPKTLCNACGVRFKGGRLLPEYRPASSPSYSSELHSNLHRKVIEMRMVKEEEAGP